MDWVSVGSLTVDPSPEISLNMGHNFRTLKISLCCPSNFWSAQAIIIFGPHTDCRAPVLS